MEGKHGKKVWQVNQSNEDVYEDKRWNMYTFERRSFLVCTSLKLLETNNFVVDQTVTCIWHRQSDTMIWWPQQLKDCNSKLNNNIELNMFQHPEKKQINNTRWKVTFVTDILNVTFILIILCIYFLFKKIILSKRIPVFPNWHLIQGYFLVSTFKIKWYLRRMKLKW